MRKSNYSRIPGSHLFSERISSSALSLITVRCLLALEAGTEVPRVGAEDGEGGMDTPLVGRAVLLLTYGDSGGKLEMLVAP